MFTKPQIATVAAEFLGTALLVMLFLVLTETTAVSYFVGTSVAVALTVIFLLFGRISGAHANPALTFGMWTARKIGTLRSVVYIAAQLLGGLAAHLDEGVERDYRVVARGRHIYCREEQAVDGVADP